MNELQIGALKSTISDSIEEARNRLSLLESAVSLGDTSSIHAARQHHSGAARAVESIVQPLNDMHTWRRFEAGELTTIEAREKGLDV